MPRASTRSGFPSTKAANDFGTLIVQIVYDLRTFSFEPVIDPIVRMFLANRSRPTWHRIRAVYNEEFGASVIVAVRAQQIMDGIKIA